MIEKLLCSNCESVQDCEYVNQIEKTEMKGVSINYIAEFYRCLSCGNEFYTYGIQDKNIDSILRVYLNKMGFDSLNMNRRQLIDAVKSAEEKEKQRRSFVFGNCNIDNSYVTREMVNEIADRTMNKCQ